MTTIATGDAQSLIRHLGKPTRRKDDGWDGRDVVERLARIPDPDIVPAGEGASERVRRVLMRCLPPGTPPSFRSIVAARYDGTGRGKIALADLVMFDGLPAKVEVFEGGRVFGGPIWAHRFTDMPGGPISLEAGRWQRFGANGPAPAQMDLFRGGSA